jgi:hypothetical protein
MSNPAPIFNRSRIEALLPLMQGWLIVAASAVLALVERSRGRHKRLLRPFVLRLERNLANWLFLSVFLPVTLSPTRRTVSRPRSAPLGFRHAREKRVGLPRVLRVRAHASLAARLRHIVDIASYPERTIARLSVRLARYRNSARLIAIAPPARSIRADAPALALAFSDSS